MSVKTDPRQFVQRQLVEDLTCNHDQGLGWRMGLGLVEVSLAPWVKFGRGYEFALAQPRCTNQRVT